MSDHSWILFSIREKSSTPLKYRNPKRRLWNKFTVIATKGLEISRNNNIIRNTLELDRGGEDRKNFNCLFQPIHTFNCAEEEHVPWWNSDLGTIRTQLRSLQ